MPVLAHCWLYVAVFILPTGSFSLRWRLLSIFFNPLWIIPCRAFLCVKSIGTCVVSIVVALSKFVFYLVGVAPGFAADWQEEQMEFDGFVDAEWENFRNLIRVIEWCTTFETNPLSIGSLRADYSENEFMYMEENHPTEEPAKAADVQMLVNEFLRADEDQSTRIDYAANEFMYIEQNHATEEPAKADDVQMLANEFLRADEDQSSKISEEEADINDMDDVVMVQSIAEEMLGIESFTTIRNGSAILGPRNELALFRGFEVQEQRAEVDAFYQEYRERMALFDRLNFERANELRAILMGLVGDSNLPTKFDCVVSTLTHHTKWRSATARKAIRGIKREFEAFYVGQSCLCWDALQYQYIKIQEMTSHDPSTRLQYDKTARTLQHFKILLERFMEDEHTGGERFWNYIHGRLAYRDLLLVPPIPVDRTKSGILEPRTLLKIVEETINTFWTFLMNEDNRPKRDLKKWLLRIVTRDLKKWLLWNVSQVEDANDLEMLSRIRRIHQEKEQSVRNLPREKRPWLSQRKGRSRLDDRDRVQYLFCSIDLKLVSRVLNMTSVSTQQLNWCEDRLANMHFDAGHLKRRRSDLLFPS